MSEFNSVLMGANFRPEEAKEIVKSLALGDELSAQREPDNAHHSNAIMILKDDTHLGYIERGLADELAPLMDEGTALSISVSGFMSVLKPYLDIDRAEAE